MLDAKEKEEMRAALGRLVERANQFIGLFLQEQFDKLDKAWDEASVTERRSPDAAADIPPQPDVGDGWRMLEVGEVAGHTDQWWHHIRQCWMANTFDGINVVSSNSHRYRRRVTPATPATPDVGDGWLILGPDEVLQEGDERKNIWGCWEAISGVRVGRRHVENVLHRRRVTPPAPELSAAAVSAMCQRNERASLLAKNATLKAESDQQQEIILHAGLEVERLTAEVERLRTENALLRCGVESLTAERDNLEFEAKVLRDERKARLGGGE